MSDSEITCGPLRVAWHPELPHVALERDGERITLVAHPAPQSGSGGWLVARGRVKGRAGPAQRVELQLPRGGAPGIRVVLEVPEAGDGVVVELRPERGSPAPVLTIDGAQPGPETLAVLEGVCFGSGALRGLLTRLDPGPPIARSGATLEIAAPAGEASPGRLWIGLGRAEDDLEGTAVVRLAAERELLPPRRGAVTGAGAPGLGHAPVEVVAPADEPPPGAGWRVGSGRPRSADVGRVDAWEPPDPLRHTAGAGRLWQLGFRLDPTMDPIALRTRASLAALAGGLVHIEAASAPLGQEARAILCRCLPRLARTPRLAAEGVLVTPLVGARVAVGLWNEGDAATHPAPTWSELGLEGPHHAFDFWEGRYLGLHDGALVTGALAPGTCRVVGLTAPAARPQVVGTTLHIGMGTLEVAALRPEPAGRRLVLRLPGSHRGRVFVAEPDGGPVRGHAVTFEGTGEALLPAAEPGSPSRSGP